MKMIRGMPGTSSEPPWDPRDPLGTPIGPPEPPLGPPGTALGPPEDVPESPRGPLGDPLWTTNKIISPQIYNARRSQLLCSNLLVGAHHMKKSTGPFSLSQIRQN